MSELDLAIARCRDYLLSLQHREGYWSGELESDVTVTAGYIPLMRFLGREDEKKTKKAVEYILERQLSDGSWSLFPGGKGDVNVSVQAYFGLKAAGLSSDEPAMKRALEFILHCGGIEVCHTFTHFLLAPFGQFPWERLPALPPELMLLPSFSPFTIYDFASWARETIVALMILRYTRPVFSLAPGFTVEELYSGRRGVLSSVPLLSRKKFFPLLDRVFKAWDRFPLHPLRSYALRLAEKWLLEHQEADGSWGGIMLPWVYALMALKSLGYRDDHPAIVRGVAGLDGFVVEDDRTLRLQPAVSPVWDTAWSLLALLESGLSPEHPAVTSAVRWLLGKQILRPGDWKVKNPNLDPGGWAFEFHNDFYPDVDDSSIVPLALIKAAPNNPKVREAVERALRWVLGLQSRDGGWAAFDRDNDKDFLRDIPFADFLPPLDPTCPDVTGHVLEFLGTLGYDGGFPSVSRALAFLKRSQEPDGSWPGRWGVNYIYGTAAALCGLRAVGEDMTQEYIRRAVAWLKGRQNGDGGWGESCLSYEEPTSKGSGPSTPSQTAWALLGLISAGEAGSPEALNGIEFLLKKQQPSGSYEEREFTGAGFPRAFYLRYHLYPIYFPLLALSRFRRLRDREAR